MTQQPREDIFVSVCLVDAGEESAAYLSDLAALADRLSERFHYWEMLLAVAADSDVDETALVGRVRNVRMLRLRSGTPFYRRRVAVAAEAIGDAVVLTSFAEIAALDLIEMIETASRTGAIVVGRAGGTHVLNHAVRALGHSAGFRVDARDMQTVAYPRTLLNLLLAHPDSALAMRFPPSDGAVPVRWSEAGNHRARRTLSVKELSRRLGLIHKLLIASAPRVLSGFALLSLLVVLSAVTYCAYVTVVWLTFAHVQPGWVTTSFFMGMTAAFLGGAIFGLAIGLQRVLDLLTQDLNEDIVGEVAAVDLFAQAMRELNIEVAGAAPLPPPPAPVAKEGSRPA